MVRNSCLLGVALVCAVPSSRAGAEPTVALGEASATCGEEQTCIAVELARTLTSEDERGSERVAERFVLDASLAFEPNRARMYSRAREVVADAARPWLTRSDLERIQVEGYTDDSGVEAYNLDLSRRRAERAQAVLLRLGFREEQVEVVAMGSRDPRASGTSAGARRKNRRVELVFVTSPRSR